MCVVEFILFGLKNDIFFVGLSSGILVCFIKLLMSFEYVLILLFYFFFDEKYSVSINLVYYIYVIFK